MLVLAGLISGACIPSDIPIPTINAPDISVTVVIEENTPANGEPAATAAPDSTGDAASNEGFMMLVYLALAMAGVAILFALFGLMRRPDA